MWTPCLRSYIQTHIHIVHNYLQCIYSATYFNICISVEEEELDDNDDDEDGDEIRFQLPLMRILSE